MPSTQLTPIEYAAGAGGGSLALSTTRRSLTLPTGFPTYRLWIHNPAASGARVFLVPQGSENTTSGITIGEGETLSGAGPYLPDDFPDLVATGNVLVYFTIEGVRSEG